MICIFSSIDDYSTTDVMKWLHHFGKEVIRVNSNEGISNDSMKIDISNETFSFQLDGRTIRLNEIEAVWYRKGSNWLCDLFYPVSVDDHQGFTNYLNYKLKVEEARLSEYLHYIIENTVPFLGSSTKGDLNKLLVLSAAKNVGLLVPDFYISNHKEGIGRVFDQAPDLITKSISDGLYQFDNTDKNTGYFTFTEKVDHQSTTDLADRFSPSFLQKNIHKKYEVRVFFLDGECFSMAILSQMDEQTKIDFRKYNEKKPNRFVPFLLPDDIDNKIKSLFGKLDLNTGSVDLMVDQEDDFYFLEINPVGQFGMVSSPCNYFLEKKVALNLIQRCKKI
ncbi:MAG: grasp-with-spasm system ATP-grasp peptide maturase [Ferruginibacter sp.]